MRKILAISLLSLTLTACATHHAGAISPADESYLQQGRRYFQEGSYKHSMQILLPLACDGIPEAQYAVGYMYYYGYGVAQDTDVGYFWIKRSAGQHYQPAIKAIDYIKSNAASKKKEQEQPKPRRKRNYAHYSAEDKLSLAMTGSSFYGYNLEKIKSDLNLAFSQPIA